MSSPFLKNSGIYIQNACLQHQYIRSKDLSNIVERPERLRAVNIGLSAAIARLHELFSEEASLAATEAHSIKAEASPDDLIDELTKLSLTQKSVKSTLPISIVNSDATVDILNHPAVKFVHGDIERDVYLENLKKWSIDSVEKIRNGESELPGNYPQGDLYRKYHKPRSNSEIIDK